MDFKTVKEVIDKAYLLEDESKYNDALEIWNTGFKNFTERELNDYKFEIFKGKIWINYLLRNSEGFINNIIDAVEKGFIYPRWMFEYKNNKEYEIFLEAWKSHPGYKSIRERNELLRAQKEKETGLKYKVYLPKGYGEKEKYPLFIAMHGDGDNMNLLMEEWESGTFLNRGYIVVYVQSSQVADHQGYSWINDPTIARRDIKTCYKTIKETYYVDEECIILGGFSGGAIEGIDILMEDVIPVKGLIAICPERKPDSVTIENIKKAVCRKVKVVFMEGEKSLPMKYEEEMLNMFREAGLPCEYYINKGLEHEIPKDLDEKLDEILEFIFACLMILNQDFFSELFI
jgi:predicted esterase